MFMIRGIKNEYLHNLKWMYMTEVDHPVAQRSDNQDQLSIAPIASTLR